MGRATVTVKTESRVPEAVAVARNAPLRVLVPIRHPVGGIRTFLSYTYGRFESGRYEFTVVAPEGPETEVLARELGASAKVIAVPRKNASRHLLTRLLSLARGERYDLIHSQGLTAAVQALPAALSTGTPHLASLHDVFIPSQFDGPVGKLKRWALARALNRVDTIHAVSEGTAENLFSYLRGLHADRVRVIRNGIPVGRFLPIAEERSRRTQRSGRTVFGFFGRFMPQKGFQDVIEAVARLAATGGAPDFVVRAVNDGSYLREYRADISRRGLDRFFEFPGFTVDVPRAMADIDAVLMPSRWEACGLLAMEALSAGVPLVATEVDGLREVLADSPALRIPAGDPAALAQAMSRVTADRDALAAQSVAYADSAQRRFAIDRAASDLESLMRNVARRR